MHNAGSGRPGVVRGNELGDTEGRQATFNDEHQRLHPVLATCQRHSKPDTSQNRDQA